MKKELAATLLSQLDLGSSVAESDNLLEAARVETSVFEDLLADRVDLIAGTKGSGKTALYRIFVDFLPDLMLSERRVVVAHGVEQRQDSVFLAYKEQFDSLSEDDFVDFWCIYLISLAYEHFVKNPRYEAFLVGCESELRSFRDAYQRARIPDLERKKSLREIIGWTLALLSRIKPKISWAPPNNELGQFELSFGDVAPRPSTTPHETGPVMPRHLEVLTSALDSLLQAVDLDLWLMLDRLDELFARRSDTERTALRGLLTTLRLFRMSRIRVKVFLRDDVLEHLVAVEGFTALTHATARKADTLRWSEDQILSMITRRIFTNTLFRDVFHVDGERLKLDLEYQRDLFYMVFSPTVYRPPNQSPTHRWIFNHTRDGRGVVTPRDVIDLLVRAGQKQRDLHRTDRSGTTEHLINGPAIVYGLEELSKEKRVNYLQAEFPHKWDTIRKLMGGGTEYSLRAIRSRLGDDAEDEIEDLLAMGVLAKATRKGSPTLGIPFLYRKGLECTQRFVSS